MKGGDLFMKEQQALLRLSKYTEAFFRKPSVESLTFECIVLCFRKSSQCSADPIGVTIWSACCT